MMDITVSNPNVEEKQQRESDNIIKKGDYVMDANGDVWTVAKVHDDCDMYNIDYVEECRTASSCNLTKIDENTYNAVRVSNVEEDKECSGSCTDCSCEKTALDTQVGGGHYKDMAIPPIEFCMKNNLNACQTKVIKYITRYKTKNGLEDLEKAKHMIDLLIGFEYGE